MLLRARSYSRVLGCAQDMDRGRHEGGVLQRRLVSFGRGEHGSQLVKVSVDQFPFIPLLPLFPNTCGSQLLRLTRIYFAIFAVFLYVAACLHGSSSSAAPDPVRRRTRTRRTSFPSSLPHLHPDGRLGWSRCGVVGVAEKSRMRYGETFHADSFVPPSHLHPKPPREVGL